MNLLLCAKIRLDQSFNTSNKSLKISINYLKKKFNLHILIFLDRKYEDKIIKKTFNEFKNIGILSNQVYFITNKNYDNYFTKSFQLIKYFINKLIISAVYYNKVNKIIINNKIDIIYDFLDCSEYLINIKNVKKILYCGHPEFVNQQIRLNFSNFFFSTSIKIKLLDIFYLFIKKFFFRIYILVLARHYNLVVKNYDKVITFNYKTFKNLKKNGYENKSFYIPFFGETKINKKYKKYYNLKNLKKINIITSVGNKSSTNNTISNYFIFKYILPKLNIFLKNKYKIITFGKGNFLFKLDNLFNFRNYLIDKGFVKNYDREFKKNHIFLLCQNSLSAKDKFIDGNLIWDFHSVHGRILDAFRNEVCIVAHSRNAESMPELINGYNCLVAASATGIARCLKKIYYDSGLRRKIILNGKKTLHEVYDNKKNMNSICNIILRA
jgi:hypothetical protein